MAGLFDTQLADIISANRQRNIERQDAYAKQVGAANSPTPALAMGMYQAGQGIGSLFQEALNPNYNKDERTKLLEEMGLQSKGMQLQGTKPEDYMRLGQQLINMGDVRGSAMLKLGQDAKNTLKSSGKATGASSTIVRDEKTGQLFKSQDYFDPTTNQWVSKVVPVQGEGFSGQGSSLGSTSLDQKATIENIKLQNKLKFLEYDLEAMKQKQENKGEVDKNVSDYQEEVKYIRENRDAAVKANMAVEKIDKMNELINSEDSIYAGTFANMELATNRFLQKIGFTPESFRELATSNTEEFKALAFDLAGQILATGEYGAGTGISQMDLQNALIRAGADLTLSKEGIQQILNNIRQEKMAQVERYENHLDKLSPEFWNSRERIISRDEMRIRPRKNQKNMTVDEVMQLYTE